MGETDPVPATRRSARWLLPLMLVVAALGAGSASASTARGAPGIAGATPEPAGPAPVAPGSPDPTCNGGHAIFLHHSVNHASGNFLVAALANGVTVIGVPSGAGSRNVLYLHAFDPDCGPDLAFGTDGVVRIGLAATGRSYGPGIEAMAGEPNGDILFQDATVK